MAEMIGAADRVASRHGTSPLIQIVTGALNGVLANMFTRGQQQHQQQAQARARAAPPPGSPPPRSQPPPQPPRRPPPPDPTLRAREILGFEPTERITAEMVNDRKKKLARVFHPDMQGGSEAQMKRVNQAADVLLAKLA